MFNRTEFASYSLLGQVCMYRCVVCVCVFLSVCEPHGNMVDA